MAAKKSRGLGRGLDALFGDMEVDILKNDNEDTPKVEESSTDANKPSAGSAAKRTAGSSENAAKAAESDGSVQNVDPAAGGILYIDINDIKPNTNQPRKVFDEEKLEEQMSMKNGINYARKVLTTEECSMLILDEVLGLVDKKVISVEDLIALIETRSEDTTILLTGRVLDDALLPYLDEVYRIQTEKE